MNFRRGSHREEPEINFIPLIDVLLVILIFLMVTTTYSRFAEMQITLPTADAQKPEEKNQPVQVAIDKLGHYAINNNKISFTAPQEFGAALRKAAGNQSDPVVIINADAQASHQSVINVMESARQVGLGKITFATQAEAEK